MDELPSEDDEAVTPRTTKRRAATTVTPSPSKTRRTTKEGEKKIIRQVNVFTDNIQSYKGRDEGAVITNMEKLDTLLVDHLSDYESFDTLRHTALRAGALMNVIQVMHVHRDKDIQSIGIRLLMRLAYNDKELSNAVAIAGGIDVIADCMRWRHIHNQEVNLRGIVAVKRIIEGVLVTREKLGGGFNPHAIKRYLFRGVRCILAAINDFPEDLTIQGLGCQALSSLIEHDIHHLVLDEILDYDGDEILRACAERCEHTDPSVYKAAKSLLQELDY